MSAAKRLWIGWPHILRALAAALSALSLAWGIARTEGLIAAMIGAAAGTLAGQRIAKSKLRLGVLLIGTIVLTISGFALISWATSTSLFPQMLGPAPTLRAAGVLRFALIAFGTASALRTAAARRPSASALELFFVTISITTVFAAHRDGLIARPLWLSDWAFRNDIDPAHILLGIGVAAAGILAVLLLVESESRRRFSSLLLLLFLAITAALGFNALALNPSDAQNNLGLSDEMDGGNDGSDGSNGQNPSNENDKQDGGNDFRPPPLSLDGGGMPEGGLLPMPFAPAPDGGAMPFPPNFGDGGIPVQPTMDGGPPFDGGMNDGGSNPSSGMDGGRNDGGQGDGGSNDGGASDGGQNDGGGDNASSSMDQLENSDGDSNSKNSPPMAVVLLENDYSPPSQAYYFREDALSQYNGARLVKSTVPNTDEDVPNGFVLEETQVPGAPSAGDRMLVSTTVVLIADHSRPFALETPLRLFPKANPNPSRFKRAYRVESLSQSIGYKNLIGRKAGNPAWTPEIRRHYTEPPTDRRFTALARAIAAALPEQQRLDPFSLAVAIKLFLDREVTYSTKERHAGAADPTADMLFGNKIGYCVHFAHAAVYLFRALGIPSRVSVGYHVEEDARRGGSAILIRDGDAHAWPELYLEGAGWVILDVSPQHNLDPPPTPVDDELQRLLGEMARGEPPEPGQPPIQKGELRRMIRTIGMLMMLFVAASLLVLYCIKIWRRLSPGLTPARQLHRRAYRAALDTLTDAGFIRQYGESRERFAERISRISPAFRELTWMHLQTALGRPNSKEFIARGEWLRLLGQMRREIGEHTGLFRRFIGILHPASFLDSR